MNGFSTRIRQWLVGLLGIAACGFAGCALPRASQSVSLAAYHFLADRQAEEPIPSARADLIRPVVHEAPASPTSPTPTPTPTPLNLPDLLAIARARNPDLAAAYARVVEAQGQTVQAGLYPNPTFGYMGNQINDGPGTAGQQVAYVNQEIVTGGKLRVARESACQGLRAADWQALTRWFETEVRVRSALVEYTAARQILSESEKIVEQFEAGLKKAEKLANAGTVLDFEVVRFRVELTQARNRLGSARERTTAAERLLAASVGVQELPAAIAETPLPLEHPSIDFESAAAAGEDNSYLREANAMVDQARGQVRLAELQNTPNLHLQAAAMYDFAIRAPMANAQAGVMLPLWNRNQGNIRSAQARLAAAAANVEQTRLRLRERLTNAVQKYRNARRQLDLYEKQILPDARKVLTQVEAIYEAKGERFFETLDARRVLAHARIDYVQSLGDLWQAISEIEGITQNR